MHKKKIVIVVGLLLLIVLLNYFNERLGFFEDNNKYFGEYESFIYVSLAGSPEYSEDIADHYERWNISDLLKVLQYSVIDGRIFQVDRFGEKITLESEIYQIPPPNIESLFIYNLRLNATKKVTYDEVKDFVVDGSNSSPDGYVASMNTCNGGNEKQEEHGCLVLNQNEIVQTLIKHPWEGDSTKFIGWIIE